MKIDLDQVLYADRYELNERLGLGKLWNIKHAKNQLLFTAFRFPAERQTEFLFFRSLVRDDYKHFFNKVHAVIHDRKKIVIQDYVCKTTKIAPRAILLFLITLPKLYSYKADGFFERIYLYMRLCFYYRQLAAVSKIEFKHLVFFADMQPVENLLAQYYRKRGKNTVTLQHGLYVDYKDYPTVNVINYLYQPSEYFLSWGEDTKKLINKYHPTRKIVICGKPTSPFQCKQCDKQLPTEKYITLIMDQNIFDEYNKKLLEILTAFVKKNTYILNIRFHPYNDKKQYKSLGYSYRDDLDIGGSSIIVGHTSSLLYELLHLGIPIYKYKTDVPCIKLPKEITFSTISELEEITKNTVDFKELGKNYIQYWGSESQKLYEKFFNGI